MKVTIKTEKEVEVKTLHVEAGVRYWEDADINDEPDTENGDNIPCKQGDLWKPVIDLETGEILNWEKGKGAEIHYKVCDAGKYFLKDANGETVISKEGYVPNMLSPKEEGFGDYIIMDIDPNGFIQDWKADIEDFENEDD